MPLFVPEYIVRRILIEEDETAQGYRSPELPVVDPGLYPVLAHDEPENEAEDVLRKLPNI